MFNSEHRRLIIKFRAQNLEDLFLDWIEDAYNVEEWHGLRPAGFLENKAQKYLDEKSQKNGNARSAFG